MNPRDLERLIGALDGVRSRDVAGLKEIQGRIDALDAERIRIQGEIDSARAALDDDDLEQFATFDRWRANRRRRLSALDEQRRLLDAQEELSREALLRSNGELEAVKRLVASARKRPR